MNMKKDKLSFLAGFAFLGLAFVSLSSCGNSTKVGEANDSVEVDTVAVDTYAVEPATQVEEAEPQEAPKQSEYSAKMDEAERLINQLGTLKKEVTARIKSGDRDATDDLTKHLEKIEKIMTPLADEKDKMTSEEQDRYMNLVYQMGVESIF